MVGQNRSGSLLCVQKAKWPQRRGSPAALPCRNVAMCVFPSLTFHGDLKSEMNLNLRAFHCSFPAFEWRKTTTTDSVLPIVCARSWFSSANRLWLQRIQCCPLLYGATADSVVPISCGCSGFSAANCFLRPQLIQSCQSSVAAADSVLPVVWGYSWISSANRLCPQLIQCCQSLSVATADQCWQALSVATAHSVVPTICGYRWFSAASRYLLLQLISAGRPCLLLQVTFLSFLHATTHSDLWQIWQIWRRRQIPPKRRFLQEPHGVTSQ
jgi:hypothetical protein